jgi:hypothetical protein
MLLDAALVCRGAGGRVSHIERIAAALAHARERNTLSDFIGEAELYCENQDCSIREVVLTIKELDGETPPRLCCPACRHQLKLHHVLTLQENRSEGECWARCSVNARLWQHNHPDELAVPLGVLLDEELLT